MPALYVTGEESREQVACGRGGSGWRAAALRLMAETAVERSCDRAAASGPQVMVIDSIQTIYTEQLQSAPGSVAQVRESAAQLVRFAKADRHRGVPGRPCDQGGHLGRPARARAHGGYGALFRGRSGSRFRVIRAIKNRFGAVNELGVFAMTDKGLREVANPSAIFLSRHGEPVPGSVVMATRRARVRCWSRCRRWSTRAT